MEEEAQERDQPPETKVLPLPEELRDLPAETVGIPPTPYETALPFQKVSPEDFERLGLVVVERVDGLREVRMYGVRGQDQHGIDLVGWEADGKVTLYQVKRYQRFSAKDLEDAVDAYTKGGGRDFRPKRLVLCVASPVEETDRTEITDALDRLREKHDFEIELYDGRRLTSKLEGHDDLIRRFFGEGWVDAIARGTSRVPSAPSQPDVLAQSALRGPLKALGLERRLAEADSAEASVDAAAIVAEVASALEEQGFVAVAAGLRVREAELLRDAGDVSGAALTLARVAWRDACLGRFVRSDVAERALRELPLSDTGNAWPDFVRTLNAMSGWYSGLSDDLSALFEIVSALADADHPLKDQVLLWACESAVAIRDWEALGSAEGAIAAAIDRRTRAGGVDDELAVRFQCCLADRSGDWSSLDARARGGELGHRLASLVHARMARAAALTRDPEGAVLNFRQAIDQACQATAFGEAAEQIHAWVRVELDYGFSNETFDRQRLSEGLREAGAHTLLPTTRAEEYGKDAQANDQLRSALTYFRQFLREAVVSGRLMEERGAEALLGAALVAAQGLDEGVKHLVRAGEYKEVAEALDGAVGWADTRDAMESGAPWERATAFASVVPGAEYLPDEVVPAVANLALDGTQDFKQSLFAPLVWIEAWKVLAAIAERLQPDQATRALDLLDPLVERDSGTYRHNDDEHVAVVAGIYRAHVDLRPRCAVHLVRLMGQDGSLAERVKREAPFVLDADDADVVQALRELADQGNESALSTLMFRGMEHPGLTPLAKDRVQQEIDNRRVAGVHSLWAGTRMAGLLARIVDEAQRTTFARRMTDNIEDSGDIESNRAESAYGLFNVSRYLSDEVRDELFDRVVRIAMGEFETNELDESLKTQSEHPLSSFRVDLRWGSLQPAAVLTASGLARSDEQFATVASLASRLLQQLPEPFARDLVHALQMLPPDANQLNLDDLSRGGSVWARQLAATVWVHRPADAPDVGARLARDTDVRVRRLLAEGLSTLAESDPGLAEQLATILRRDVAWSVRSRVALRNDETP